MKQRGRKSAGELAIASPATVAVERPEPPLELTPEQSDVWNAIVSGREADWFTEDNFSVLVQHCRHVIEARRIAQLIDQECSRDETDVSAYLELLKAQHRETASITSTATKMRLTQQSARTEREAAKKTRTVRRPWEG